ncbi:MAG: hypothetical protein ACJ71I_07865 [Nitrososphaeraceae archaeon]
MSISSRRNELNIHSSSSIPASSGNTLTRLEILEYPDSDDNMINHLDIAEGLKNMLVSQGFNLESLLIILPHDLSEILGIDEYVAKIIIGAAHAINKK